ncbi:MAG: sulfatase [Rikenellaceae bacterium]
MKNARLFLLPLCLTASLQVTAKAKQPNVIFILADDLAWSDVGYNSGEDSFYQTPKIDSLAKSGIILNNFYPGGANSAPSRANLVTGMSNVRTKFYTPNALAKGEVKYMRYSVPNNTFPKERPFESHTELSPEIYSIAEMLNSVGYNTARIGKWHLGADNQGFKHSSSDGEKERLMYNVAQGTELISAASLKFIEQNKDNPFFLYVAYFDVHTPLVADQKLIDKHKQRWASWPDKSTKLSPIYAAMIEQVDNSVGDIFDKIHELNLSENTLIIFASDNGGVSYITNNAPLKGGKGNLYEGGIRTPAFACWPGVIKPNSESSTPVHSLDIMPTLAEISGAKLPDNQPVDGVSIMNVLKGKKLKERTLYWHYPLYLMGSTKKGALNDKVFPIYGTNKMYWRAVPSSAILKQGWKLIYFYEYDKCELYNIEQDLSEKHELSEKNPKKVEELKQDLFEWLKLTSADIPQKENPRFDANFVSKKKK